MKIYIGAENITSPLGFTAVDNFSVCYDNKRAITEHQNLALNDAPVWVSRFNRFQLAPEENQSRIFTMLQHSVSDSLRQTTLSPISNNRIALILSTTKGDIESLENGGALAARPGKLLNEVAASLSLIGQSIVVSNACISGTQALILAHDWIASGRADHVIVTGADLVTRFTVTGFQSLFALSNEPCRPFSKTRSGISLGECAATLAVSRNPEIFKTEYFTISGGAVSNDANHISGPSRTGEGLFRAIQKTLASTGVTTNDIDFISAHGTGTLFNDDMESVAFNRAGLAEIPVNSFKGYFGHTLGAAGLMESAMCLQSMKKNVLLKSAGFMEPGTAQPLNVLKEHVEKRVNTILKTASGFGGCNAALILKRGNPS